MRRGGLSLAQIAHAEGVTRQAVSLSLRKHGDPLSGQDRGGDPTRWTRIQDMRRGGMSMAAIGRAEGVTTAAVSESLKRHGDPARMI